MKTLLLLPKISIQNANALSSPVTIGFPALTAWQGVVHALQRKLKLCGFDDLAFAGFGVVSHVFDLQTERNSLIIPKRPVSSRKDLAKFLDKKAPAFIEEARCHLTVSLLIEFRGLARSVIPDSFCSTAKDVFMTLKLAGGDILSCAPFEIKAVADEKSLRQLTRRVMPGYVLIERRELMKAAMQDGQDAIDALLDYLTIQHRKNINADDEITWSVNRKTAGWIVPIASGFHGVSALGHAENQRDPATPHRFAESLVTLGEFVMPYRIKRLEDLLWRSRFDAENNFYLIEQNNCRI